MRVTTHLIPDKLNKQIVTDSCLFCSFAPGAHLTAPDVQACCLVGTAHVLHCLCYAISIAPFQEAGMWKPNETETGLSISMNVTLSESSSESLSGKVLACILQ